MTSPNSESIRNQFANCPLGECNYVATIWLLCPDVEHSPNCRQKQFASLTELDFHIQLHHRRLPKQCPVRFCPIAHLTREELVHHVSTEHRTGRWPCRHCSSAFSACRVLFHHIFLFHEPGLFKCQQHGCEFSSNCRQDVLRHFMTVHKSLSSVEQDIAGRSTCMCRQLNVVNPAFQKQQQQQQQQRSNGQIHLLQLLSDAAQSQNEIVSPARMFAPQQQVRPHEQQLHQRFPAQMLSNQIQPFKGTAQFQRTMSAPQQQQYQQPQIPQMHQLYSQFVNSRMVTPQQQMQQEQVYLNQIEQNKQMHPFHDASQSQHYMTQAERFMAPFQTHHQGNQRTAVKSLQMQPLFGPSQSQPPMFLPERHPVLPQRQPSQMTHKQIHQMFQDAARIQSSQPLDYVTRPNTIQSSTAHSRNSVTGNQVYGRPRGRGRGRGRSNGRIPPASSAHSSFVQSPSALSNMITSQHSNSTKGIPVNYLALVEHSLDIPFSKDNPLLLQLVDRMSANNPNGLPSVVHSPCNSTITQDISTFSNIKKSKQSSVQPNQLPQMSSQNGCFNQILACQQQRQQAAASGSLVLPLQSPSLSNGQIQMNPIADKRGSEMGLPECNNIRILADNQCHLPVFSKRPPNIPLNDMEQRRNFSSCDASPMAEMPNQTAISTPPIVRSSPRVSSTTNFFAQAVSQMTSSSIAQTPLFCQMPNSTNHCNLGQIAYSEMQRQAVMATVCPQVRYRQNSAAPSQLESGAMRFYSRCPPKYQPSARLASASNLTSSQSELLPPHYPQTSPRKRVSVNYSIPDDLISEISDGEGADGAHTECANKPPANHSGWSIPFSITASMQEPLVSANAEYCVEPVSKPYDDGHVMLRFFKKSKMDSTKIQEQSSATEQPGSSVQTGQVSTIVPPQAAVPSTGALNSTYFSPQIEDETETLSKDCLLEIAREHEETGLANRSIEVDSYEEDSQDEEDLENGKLIIVEQIEESIDEHSVEELVATSDGTIASGAKVDNNNSPPQFDCSPVIFSKMTGSLSNAGKMLGVISNEPEERHTNEMPQLQVNSDENLEMETSDIFLKKLLLDLRRDIVRKSTVSVSVYSQVRDNNNNDFSIGSELANENKENSPTTESSEAMVVSMPPVLSENNTMQANVRISTESPIDDTATNSSPDTTEQPNGIVSESAPIQSAELSNSLRSAPPHPTIHISSQSTSLPRS